MSYKSVLVNIDIDGPVAPIVKAASDLAARLQARLIGLCVADAPMPIIMPDGAALAGEAWQQMRNDIESRFKDVRASFAKSVGSSAETEWRDVLDNPTRGLTEAARTADLVVMGAAEGADSGDLYRSADPGSVVLQAGRPMLVVAKGADHVPAKKAVIGWKDTREARRAVADAVPLLACAEQMTIVTVAEEVGPWIREGVADVAAFLSRHGIQAGSEMIESSAESRKLAEFISSSGADLVVTGAYGHSRLRQWAFGGVTRSLLDETGLHRFMSC